MQSGVRTAAPFAADVNALSPGVGAVRTSMPERNSGMTSRPVNCVCVPGSRGLHWLIHVTMSLSCFASSLVFTSYIVEYFTSIVFYQIKHCLKKKIWTLLLLTPYFYLRLTLFAIFKEHCNNHVHIIISNSHENIWYYWRYILLSLSFQENVAGKV
jgi:hypothetical protein